jgi:hypothetical protein
MTPSSLSIRLNGCFFNSTLSFCLHRSFFDAMALAHSLPDPILRMPGMSGRRYRMFINNLMRLVHNPKYLEVGSWLGSTACSAMWGNSAKVVCVDNWTEFGGPKEAFLHNVEIAKSKCDFHFIENDFRSVDYASLGYFNIYMFDGPHEESDQYDGIVCPYGSLEQEFILIVDDYNWQAVRAGTARAVDFLQLNEVCSIEVRTTQDNSQPNEILMEKSDWHNGYYLAVMRKEKVRY